LGLDRTRWPEVLVGLVRVRVLEVARGGDGRLHVTVETTDELAVCRSCGCRAEPKDRDRVGFADLPAFGSPVRLVWAQAPLGVPRAGVPDGHLDRGASRHRAGPGGHDGAGGHVGHSGGRR
jgi:hypothetical protein